MIDEASMRAAMQEYIDAFNRDDVDAVVGLYADDATVEDQPESANFTGCTCWVGECGIVAKD